MNWVSLLPSRTLSDLASHLRRNGRTGALSVTAARGIVPDAMAESIAEAVTQLLGQGWSAEQVATLLESIVQDRGTKLTVEEGVELVTTGPELGDVYNRDTLAVVDQLFREAQESLLIVGYALYKAADIFRPLAERMNTNPNLKVTCCFDIQRKDKDTTAPQVLVSQFASRFRTVHWPSGTRLPEIYYDPRSVLLGSGKRASLHAKCIIADGRKVFISSANFTEAAQERNIEAGVLIRSARLADQLSRFVIELIRTQTLILLPSNTGEKHQATG